MVVAIQKIALILCASGAVHTIAHADPLTSCSTAPLVVALKTVGRVTYAAQHCQQPWQHQSIQLNFEYTRAIPEWAFKRAATYFLNKNISTLTPQSDLHRITQLYRSVKPGDLYSLFYDHSTHTLSLSLNQQYLGSISGADAGQYVQIWFGNAPFSATLKQQLLP